MLNQRYFPPQKKKMLRLGEILMISTAPPPEALRGGVTPHFLTSLSARACKYDMNNV